MSLSWNKIKLVLKIAVQVILHPIDTYRTYKFYRSNKDKVKTVLNEIKPMLVDFKSSRSHIEEYVAVRFKELGIRDELIGLVDYIASYIEKTDTETIVEVVKEYVPDEEKIRQVLENLTPADIEFYKLEAIKWLKTL